MGEKKEPVLDEGRVKVINRIAEYEKQGLFNVDVEDDLPPIELKPEDIDYLRHGLKYRIQRNFAFFLARAFFFVLRKKKVFVMKKIEGIENLNEVKGGVIFTCNHFNLADTYVTQAIFDKCKRDKRFYRVIKEGNFTTSQGIVKILMKYSDTLPLSSNKKTMINFLRGVKTLLNRGRGILIYPEQAMWWNYKKPRPLQIGAFDLAVKNNVPVVPCFVTLTDTGLIGKDGFPVYEYIPHIGKAIYPDASLLPKEASEKMKEQNYNYNKSVYESFYGEKLS